MKTLNSMTGGNTEEAPKGEAKEKDINYISSFELYPKTLKAPTKKNKNPILELPADLQIIINEYAQDKTLYKIFNDSFDMYYKLYKNIKLSFNINDNIKIYNEFEEEGNKNFIVIVNKKNYYVDLMTPEQTETEIKDYLQENIIFLYNDISFFERVLKDQYYIKNNFRLGIKKSIIKKIKKAIEEENHILIYNLIDLDALINNYFRFNNICDLLNLYNIINNIRIIENGEREGTRRATRYNILIREN